MNPEEMKKGNLFLGFAVSEENPIEVPECCGEAEIEQRWPFATRLKLSGCSKRYHPWSGRKLNGREQAFWRTAAIVVSSEAGADPQAEAVRQVKERNTSATEAEIA